MSDDYVLESFIGGLEPSIKPFVIAFNPRTITEAVRIARLQEAQWYAQFHKPKQSTPVIYNPKPLQSFVPN